MEFKKKDNFIYIRMRSGENLFDNLKEIMKDQGLDTAIILSSLGMLKDPSLGYFNGTEYDVTEFKGKFELLSLQGNIVKDNQDYIVHLHAILGKEDTTTFGGHVVNATVWATNEMVLLPAGHKIERVLEENGLKGWKVD